MLDEYRNMPKKYIKSQLENIKEMKKKQAK